MKIPIVVGEIVHQLRSCFDHLIWALVLHNGQRPHNGLQFPTARNREKFDKAVADGNIRGVREDAAEFIQSMQPYLSDDPKTHMLSIIHFLDVVDKHRVILTAAAGGRLGNHIVIKGADGNVTISKMGPPVLVRLDQEEKEFFYLEFAEPHSHFECDVGFSPQICLCDIAGDELYPVDTAISHVLEFTKNVVTKSIKYFD